jgi:hypothetical protein
VNTIPPDAYTFVDRLGVVLILVSFVFGLWRGWWVMGREFDRVEKECAELRAQAKADADTIQRAVHLTWQMVGTVRDTVRTPPSGGV